MNIVTDVVFGVHVWIWLLFFCSMCSFLGVIAYWKRELVRKIYFTMRFRERLIKVVIHFPGRLYKVYWRLIPTDGIFTVDKKDYIYDSEVVSQEDDFFIDIRDRENKKLYIVKNLFVKKDKKGVEKIKLGELGEKDFSNEFEIREKGRKYSEVHYIYNLPKPLKFDVEVGELELTGEQLSEFKKNNLFMKLLTMQSQKNIMMFLIILGIINTGISLFLLAKQMGWIE